MEEMEQLYRKYQTLLCHYLYNICGNSLLAEEIAQETFVQITFRCCSGSCFIPERFFRKTEPVESQIFRLACRLLCRERTRMEIELPTEPELLQCEEIPTEDYLPESFVMHQLELEYVCEKIKSLKEPVRSVITLKYYEGMTYREIASCLRQSENWVKHLIARGKEQLGKVLQSEVCV